VRVCLAMGIVDSYKRLAQSFTGFKGRRSHSKIVIQTDSGVQRLVNLALMLFVPRVSVKKASTQH